MLSPDIIRGRLSSLREKMRQAKVNAVIVPHADPHQSEYPASHWLVREFFSGFDGSAGTLVVTDGAACLITDSRYWLQAARQLADTGIELIKDGLPESPDILRWLCGHLTAGGTVAADGRVMSASGYRDLSEKMRQVGLNLVSEMPWADEIWTERPALPLCPVRVHDEALAGESAGSKLAKLLEAAREAGADCAFVGDLAEIAWLLNIRSNDVIYNPVVTAYLFVSADESILFVDDRKLTEQVCEYLAGLGVRVAPYVDALDFLAGYDPRKKVMMDPARVAYSAFEAAGERVVAVPDPMQRLKAIKNSAQLDGMRRAHIEDGVALTYGFMELLRRLEDGEELTEVSVDEILTRHRAERPGNDGLSFETIAGYAEHGAIVHYSATEESASTLKPEGLLLVDSGAQFPYGTTDITRTISLGHPTDDEILHYTIVLQGTVDLAAACFPEGTRGAQLDVLARAPMWKHGLNYLHGTGHGVGHYLNVHEGPHSIRMQENPVLLEVGMVTSDEPGIYLAGRYGIRLENLLAVVPAMEGECGRFLKFEVLTLFPFDASLTDFSMLTAAQADWLRRYHQQVYDTLSPHLDDAAAMWLYSHCAPFIENGRL